MSNRAQRRHPTDEDKLYEWKKLTAENAGARAQLAALRAVVEEARDEIESWKINANLEVVANEAAVLAILPIIIDGLTSAETEG